MELKELARWRQSEETDLFYNNIDKKFFIKQEGDILILHENDWIPGFFVGEIRESRLKNACISSDSLFFCYQITETELVTHK